MTLTAEELDLSATADITSAGGRSERLGGRVL